MSSGGAALAGGLEVGRVLPFAKQRMVGPFIFFDHMGPLDFPPGLDPGIDIRPHPHIGLSTVTYLFSGDVMRPSRGEPHHDQSIRIGHDVIEKPPFFMQAGGAQVIHISSKTAEVHQALPFIHHRSRIYDYVHHQR